MLKRCDMSLMQKIDEAIPFAAKDCFEYEVEEIMQHAPAGPRRTASGLRNKNEYEFRVEGYSPWSGQPQLGTVVE
jgi:hypothetical protein